jgi:hypothetical protein
MQTYVQRRCLEILSDIETHPISNVFKEAVDPERDQAPRYFDIVKHPMDLGTIRERLERNHYKTVQNWREDMLLTFSNAIAYNGKTSSIGTMASELQALFREATKGVVDDPHTTWLNELMQLRKDMGDHLKSRTSVQLGDLSVLLHKETLGTSESSAEMRRFLVNSMSHDDLEKLAASLRKCARPEQLERIAEIIRRGNPEMAPAEGSTIDLSLLATQTLNDLRTFVEEDASERSSS